VVALIAALALGACSQGGAGNSVALRQAQDDTRGAAEGDTGTGGAGQQIQVVTTFSTLNSFVEGVGGAHVAVRNLVPVGASPENYQPAPRDIAALNDAQLVVQNGGGIEAWLQHTIASAGNPAMKRVVLSDGLPKIDHNPHLWMDPVLARAYVGKIRDALAQLDPEHKADYARNAAAYDAQLHQLQTWIGKQIATIPPQHRAMIIFHNAFDYYNRRFGIRTVGVIELNPGQDPNPAYIGHLVDLAREHHVHAVFSEPEYSPKLAQTLAKSANVEVVTNLYDDSLGNDPRVNNYVNMLRYDTGVIVQALK
jgi:ABC-type Zn uptake system ZnuABC Zn-binding protein ZnuA